MPDTLTRRLAEHALIAELSLSSEGYAMLQASRIRRAFERRAADIERLPDDGRRAMARRFEMENIDRIIAHLCQSHGMTREEFHVADLLNDAARTENRLL